MKYLRIISILMGASLGVQLEYRANFTVNLLETALRLMGSVLGLSILFGGGESVAGWTFAEALAVLGIFTFFDGLISMALAPNLNRIAEGVRTGTLDFVLLKPVDAQFLVSFRNIDLLKLPDVLLGLGILGWSLGHTGVRLENLLLGAGLLLTAYLIVYSIWFALSTTAFWFVRVENVTELFWGVYRAGQFPIQVFPGWVRTAFTFVIPIAFITTVPAEAFTGRLEGVNLWAAVGMGIGLFVASRGFWRFALRAYTSASS